VPVDQQASVPGRRNRGCGRGGGRLRQGRQEGGQPTRRRRRAGGHELANHTWSHVDIIHLPQAGVRDEIIKCRDVIASETGVHADCFRPSQTDVPNDLILSEAGLAGYGTVVGYDIDPLDDNDPGATLVLSRVRDALHRGAIVSLQLGHPGTVTAFDGIVRSIRARGLRPVLVRDLLGQG
jgi:peptidoglycan/xylan/chitin deacetylase (PgdA/CDA1 family)